MDIESVKMGERGQIVIPQDFRKEMGLRKGEKFIAVLVDEKIVLEPVKHLKGKKINEIEQDLEDARICASFWDDVKSGKVIEQEADEDAQGHLFDLLAALRLRAACRRGMSPDDLTPDGLKTLRFLEANAEDNRAGSAARNTEPD